MIYNDVDLSNATVLLCYKNAEGNSGCIELQKNEQPYDSTRVQFDCKVNSYLTSVAGPLTLWLKIYDYSKSNAENYSLETSEVSVTITPSKEVKNNVNAKSLDYFDQCNIKMMQVYNAALKAVRDATEQANIARTEVNKMKMLKGGD